MYLSCWPPVDGCAGEASESKADRVSSLYSVSVSEKLPYCSGGLGCTTPMVHLFPHVDFIIAIVNFVP